ncbi:non-ribosomal peptide synthetase [Paenarthrobacter sp. PAE-2]|uniref:non-ribosomal peptide synthetase n=1 Tax=Paenarthrobacter sp. PAE-2 TaxID=2982532 RepID=UPI0022314865|nr:non-ribosomal peptide synthetase [Paenarthrobacter sp. PAE-2]MCW3768754.1 non-ribosomal peptide synthetase [Paenarthrobacter sp. PAE-2]
MVYLAALSSGNPLLILPAAGGTAAATLIAAYDPDIVVRASGGEAVVDVRREETRHELHPELALLLSTSGSTGSPKLVRLSAEAVQANASAIAQYLHLRPGDTAATTLPFSYCYGMSVVNSHLLAAVEGQHDLALVAKTLAQDLGLPRSAIQLHPVKSIPRLTNGKPDYPAVLALASRKNDRAGATPIAAEPAAYPAYVRRIFAEVLEQENIADTDTFVSLDGDSLSYVAASVRLERALGIIPQDWHHAGL